VECRKQFNQKVTSRGCSLPQAKLKATLPLLRSKAEPSKSAAVNTGWLTHSRSMFKKRKKQLQTPPSQRSSAGSAAFCRSSLLTAKGGLAKYRVKIEHERVLRGKVGERVLAQLLKEGVLYMDPKFYHVDSDKLSKVLGTTSSVPGTFSVGVGGESAAKTPEGLRGKGLTVGVGVKVAGGTSADAASEGRGRGGGAGNRFFTLATRTARAMPSFQTASVGLRAGRGQRRTNEPLRRSPLLRIKMSKDDANKLPETQGNKRITSSARPR
jgi:hypothetical protein